MGPLGALRRPTFDWLHALIVARITRRAKVQLGQLDERRAVVPGKPDVDACDVLELPVGGGKVC
jgi:hypothetical protein